MNGNPLEIMKKLDSQLFEKIAETGSIALADGALSRKHKLLTALALDAAHGASDGVASLARQALEAGATKAEIAETIRVAYYITGVGSVYTAARGLSGVL